MKILADDSLPLIESCFGDSFTISYYSTNDEIANLIAHQDILICRSTLKVDKDLLASANIKCVATASSGSDHIDKDYLKAQNIKFFAAKGCNAEAVTDYVTSVLAWLYTNNKINGNKAGIIGMGHVGTRVNKRLLALGFKTITYDPYILPIKIDEITGCDLLFVHANLHNNAPYPSKNLINAEFLHKLNDNCIIINAARGNIVNEHDLLNTKRTIYYCTDVYSNEPRINEKIINTSLLCTPHIAGHSIEAKENAVFYLSDKIKNHLNMPTQAHNYDSQQIAEALSPNEYYKKVLSIYNPYKDSCILKGSDNKRDTFLERRKLHNKRHDFSYYENL